jgi:hypothetical protein
MMADNPANERQDPEIHFFDHSRASSGYNAAGKPNGRNFL